jgi:flagellar basal-body rod protein FlgF
LKDKIFLVILFLFISHHAFATNIETYIILSKQDSLLDTAEVISNNIANSETPGFKESQVIEKQYYIKSGSKQSNLYVNDIASVKNMSDGNLTLTSNALDLAILGKGFFTIATPNGTRYTRAGNFILNSNSNIVTVDGFHVLGIGQNPISIPPETTEIAFTKSGEVKADGQVIDQLGITNFNNVHMLDQVGQSLWIAKNGANPQPATPEEYNVLQGYIESSNVNKIHQLTRLVEVQRDASSVGNLINNYDELGHKVIDKLLR